MLKTSMLCMMFLASGSSDSCNRQPLSTSGIEKLTVKVQKNEKGLTVEQDNIAHRLKLDNQPGSIKHLYVISTMSGEPLFYSTVKGKVTSSGKRLSPNTLSNGSLGFDIDFPGATTNVYTSEILQDDGTYGSSVEYLYWWDTNDRYHQHYITGGQMLHVSDQPLPIKKVAIRLDMVGDHEAPEQKIDEPVTIDKKK